MNFRPRQTGQSFSFLRRRLLCGVQWGAVLLYTVASLGCSSPGDETVAVAQVSPQPQAEAQSPASTTSTVDGPPRLVFTESIFDFGKVEQGAQVNYLFRFTNQGGRDLRIESVKTSCGCTAAVISSEVLAPGQEGTISATFDTSHFSGEKTKEISVYSNDPTHAVTTLTLQGEITVEIEVEPPQLYLGRVRRGEETVRSVDVVYDADKQILRRF